MRILLLLTLLAQAWETAFPVDVKTLVTEGQSAYFVLKPGFQATFQDSGGKLVVTVLGETQSIGGVNTRVVEEREWKGTQLVEVSRNYLALDPRTGDVYYFGEDVDTYKHGTVANHEGSW